MTARLVNVCQACQENNHVACPEGACICFFRGHPERTPIKVQANQYRPDPSAA